MDAVKSFNAELSALYDVKPPISKAKMTALTRGAIKAIKFYKHVVQSVEKFILKCRPEYKIPGLYVIDSIVRQSRHQFGADKDVFAPRFAKNMQQTFVNLFRCPPEDKSKVIRVLNLWQKNQVFAPDVIQPLFDLADPNHPIHREQAAVQNNGITAQAVLNSLVKVSPALQKSPTKLLQQSVHQGDAASTLAHLGMANLANNPNMLLGLQAQSLDPNMLNQLQTLHRLLVKGGDTNAKPEGVHFDRKLLDFDYGSDEEEDPNLSPKVASTNPAMDSLGNLLSNPEVMRQLQNLQQQISQQSQQKEMEEKIRRLQEMKQQEEEFDKHLAQTVPNLPFAAECELKPASQLGNSPAIWTKQEAAYLLTGVDMTQPPPGYKPYDPQAQAMEEANMESEVEFVDNGDVEVINLDNADSQSRSSHDDRYSSRRRGRSRSRDRSRDRSGRDRRSRRSRSRSRSRRKRTRSREKEREKEREEREKDRERRKRGLPPLKKENLSVCSTTLWVGHLSKLVHQEDLSDTFGEFGDIVSIDLIPPRGCAFIVMHRRQDASRCLLKLKNHKMQGKAITLAWAPGKGVKGKDLKDYWDIELGVSYIPWNKVRQDIDMELLEDGGMIDEDTMPLWMKTKMAQMQPKPTAAKPAASEAETAANAAAAAFMTMANEASAGAAGVPDTSQPPPMHGGAGLLPPPPMAMPLVPPFPMNTRLLGPMGMSMSGLMPNVPIGVPPPNALMSNLGLGMGSPFGQGPPGMLTQQLQMPPVPSGNPPSGDNKISDMEASIYGGQGLLPTPHGQDENMDVEMEDAEKSDKPLTLSDQLLASIGQYNGNGPNSQNLNAAVGRLQNSGSRDHRPNPGGLGSSDVDERHSARDNNRGRERDRDRGRDRDRSDRGAAGAGGGGGGGRRNSRDRNRREDRDRRDDRDNNRDGNRDNNRENSRDNNRDASRDNNRDNNRDNARENNSRDNARDNSRDNARDNNSRDNARENNSRDNARDNNSRDNARENNSRDNARGGRADRDRGGNNRWGDSSRDGGGGRAGRDRSRDNREDNKRGSERSEKTVNDRLREMANESTFTGNDRRAGSRDRSHGGGRDREPRFEPPEVVPPPLLDRPVFPPPSFGPPNEPPHLLDEPNLDEDDLYRGVRDFDHGNNFDMRMRRHLGPGGPPLGPPGMGPPGPDFLPDRYDDGPEFDGPPMHMQDRMDGPPDRFDFRRPEPPPFDDMRMIDDFDPRMRGGPPGPDFYPPPRDGFGPRGPPPMMRGPGPDGFPPRGPPMMGPRGPPMFHPRGMRGGPRPGPWMDGGGGGGMRPPNFPPHGGPHFDGPPDGGGPPFFNRGGGPPFDNDGPPGLRHGRGGRHDDRRGGRFRGQDDNDGDGPDGPLPPREGERDRERGDRDRERGDKDRERGDRERGDKDRERGDKDRERGDKDRERGDKDRERGDKDRERGDRDRERGEERSGRDRSDRRSSRWGNSSPPKDEQPQRDEMICEESTKHEEDQVNPRDEHQSDVCEIGPPGDEGMREDCNEEPSCADESMKDEPYEPEDVPALDREEMHMHSEPQDDDGGDDDGGDDDGNDCGATEACEAEAAHEETAPAEETAAPATEEAPEEEN